MGVAVSTADRSNTTNTANTPNQDILAPTGSGSRLYSKDLNYIPSSQANSAVNDNTVTHTSEDASEFVCHFVFHL